MVVTHLLWLSRHGVGQASVAKRAGVAESVVERIRNGKITRTRVATAQRLLAVDLGAIANGATVDGAPTWAMLDALFAHGYKRGWVARALGSMAKVATLQLKRDRVTARNARKVAALYQQMRVNDVALPNFHPNREETE